MPKGAALKLSRPPVCSVFKNPSLFVNGDTVSEGEESVWEFSNGPVPFFYREAVKKLLQIERAGRDIGKVLQRYILTSTAHD